MAGSERKRTRRTMASSVELVILYVVLGVFRSRGQSLRSQRPQGPINPSFPFCVFCLYSHSILPLFCHYSLCSASASWHTFPHLDRWPVKFTPISLMRATLCVYCISLALVRFNCARNCPRPPSPSSNG